MTIIQSSIVGWNSRFRGLTSDWLASEQRWVIAVKTKIQLPNTLPIILSCVIGIIKWM